MVGSVLEAAGSTGNRAYGKASPLAGCKPSHRVDIRIDGG